MNERISKSDFGSCRPQDIKNQIPLPLVLKFPFLTETVRHLVNCGSYKYVSILTDGGINPNPNITAPIGTARNNLMLEFDNGDIWQIDAETYNLNIERYNSLYFSNLNFSAAIVAHPQGGYGNLFLVFTMEKYRQIKDFKRHNPTCCFHGSVPAQGSIVYHLGTFRQNFAHILGIPFIPRGYEKFNLLSWRQHGGVSFKIDYYCCDNNLINIALAIGEGCNTYDLCTDRIKLTVNGDFANPYNYCFIATLINKSDGGK